MKARIIHVIVRRDAHTITPTTVFEHEIPLLQTIFGAENIQRITGKPVGDADFTDADIAGDAELSEDEFARLASKYGANEDGDIVEQVYGKRATGALDAALKKLADANSDDAPTKKKAAKE